MKLQSARFHSYDIVLQAVALIISAAALLLSQN